MRVRESFEEWNTGASSLCGRRGLPCRFRGGCEPIGGTRAWLVVGPLLPSVRPLLQLLLVRLWSYQLSCLSPRLTDP